MSELRETLDDAWEKAEKMEEQEKPIAEEGEPREPENENSDPSPEKEPEKEPPKADANPEQKKKEPPAPEQPKEKPVKAEADTTRLGKAPAGWTPRAREQWKNIPESARGEILKRETEIATTLQQTAGARQAVQRLNDVLTPYRGGLMAAGVKDPFQAIDTLFKTESQLRHGNVQEKAFTIANLIKQYGVDVGALDDILSGQAPANKPHSDIERIIDARLAPVNQFLQQQSFMAQQHEMSQQQAANQSVAAFAGEAEFLEDVRNDMADFLEMAAARGQTMTLKQAYDKACALHPEVSQIIAQREKEKAIMGTQQSIQAKRHAAASLTGSKGGEGGGGSPSTIRDAITDAWNQAMG